MQEYQMDKAKVWFVRMSLTPSCSIMACGNTAGQVYVWDMHNLTDRPQAVLSRHPLSKVLGKSTSSNITVCFLDSRANARKRVCDGGFASADCLHQPHLKVSQ